MISRLHLEWIVLAGIVAYPLVAGQYARAEPAADTEHKLLTGHVGFGPYSTPRYSGSENNHTLLLPQVSVEIADKAYIDFWEAGLFVYANESKTFGVSLIVYPRFGFNASDSPRLRGMARRNTSIESGPALNFDFGVGVVSMAYVQDVSGASHGGTFRLLAEREFHIQSNLAVDVILTWEQLSAKTANYYYGVPTNEITPTRSFYQPQSDRILNANLQFTYDFAGRHALLFGGELSVLGDHLAASPIVERRWSRTLYIGYGWRL